MTDNFDDFMQALENSLENAPMAKHAQRQLSEMELEPFVRKTLDCDDKKNRTFTGHYKTLKLRNCRGIVLRNLVTESIEMHESEVTIENVRINSGDVGLSVFDSVVVATLLTIDARVGMEVSGSYLDIAGATFIASGEAVKVLDDSQLYFSLSKTVQKTTIRPVHGVSLGASFQLN